MGPSIKSVGISDGGRALNNLRNAGYFDGFCGVRLTGARSSVTTGFGLWSAKKELDLFAAAVGATGALAIASNGWTHGENPYNNFLNAQQKPIWPIYPKVAGFYIGERGNSGAAADVQQMKAMIAEHSTLELKVQSGARHVLQPVTTLPPGMGFTSYSTDAAFYSEQMGPTFPAGMYQLPDDAYVDQGQVYQAILKIDPDVVTALVAMAGNFDASGFVMGVHLIGGAEYKVAAAGGRL